MSTVGQLETTYTASGLARYQVNVSHPQLHKYQVVRGDNPGVVKARARHLAAQWDEAWEKRSAIEQKRTHREAAARNVEEKRQIAAQRTEEAKTLVASLSAILAYTMDIDDTIDWDLLKDHADFPTPKPADPKLPPKPKPVGGLPEPQQGDFQAKLGFMDKMMSGRRQSREAEAQTAFSEAHAEWEKTTADVTSQNEAAERHHAEEVAKLRAAHDEAVAHWEADAEAFAQEQAERNREIDERRERYMSGDPEALADYCSMVLDNSDYPDCLPKSFELDYNPVNKIVIVDYQLCAPADIPAVIEVKYVASSDSFSEKTMPQRQFNELYDSVLYQVALRTVHELFEADAVQGLDAVVFNGWVHSVDSSTGRETDACVVSLQVGREELEAINLCAVEPRACFKKLKGVSAARLHSLTPIAPLLAMDRDDRRFVASRAVVDSIAEGDNLACMDWEDFEHLIRELFEQEFSGHGSEVKVTQASRDGGVDAVVFDPDPLHGGKTVIQAKRYTNTVGVSAVRDLYGTMMNEGANKGILVTTSDYGPDAYEFVKSKPLVLLTGGNLLHLLEKHGHKARIDLQEARLLALEEPSAH